jgi:hypothetical protein
MSFIMGDINGRQGGMTPKRQHFIPRVHLKHFAGADPKGQVWTYDAISETVRSGTPENTAVESHFYSAEMPDGTMDTSLEEFLATIEDTAAPIYEALLNHQIPKASQGRADFSVFLGLMVSRTPAMRRMMADVKGRGLQIQSYAYATNDRAFDGLMQSMEREEGRVLGPETRELARKAMLDPSGFVMELPKERTLSALNAADGLAPIFFNMTWSVVTPQHGYFITSDNPVVREVDPKTRSPFYGDGGFMNKTAEVIFPLAPQALLFMSWRNVARQTAFSRDLVNRVNRSIAANSDRYLYAHLCDKRLERLAAEFKNSRPGMTVSGFGPEKFAEVQVMRRSRKTTVRS